MFFFFKRPKINVDCFITDEHILKYSPIEKANKFIPKWWKKIPSVNNTADHSEPTIKGCSGIIEQYKRGLIIPMWSDLSIIMTDQSYSWKFSDGISNAEVHSNGLDSFLNPKEYAHLKLISPWFLNTKEDIFWTCLDPFWNNTNKTNYITVPGTVSYKYQHATHINLMMPVNNRHFNIEHGHPVYHLLPLTEKEIQIKHQLVTEKELNKYKVRNITFFNTYYKRLSIDKNKEKSKCPFHRGN